MNEKVNVTFYDTVNALVLGKSLIPFVAITKLNIGDKLEFKDSASIFGVYEIKSFAVNHGHPEGRIDVIPIKAKARIKLHQVNNEYMESLFPF